MSGFCVFGISRANCKRQAENAACGEGYNRLLTMEMFRQRVSEIEQALFEGRARHKQISPAFDAPQFAEEWIKVGLMTMSIAHPKIMARGVKTDKRGNKMVNKKGVPIISWIPYEPQRRTAA